MGRYHIFANMQILPILPILDRNLLISLKCCVLTSINGNDPFYWAICQSLWYRYWYWLIPTMSPFEKNLIKDGVFLPKGLNDMLRQMIIFRVIPLIRLPWVVNWVSLLDHRALLGIIISPQMATLWDNPPFLMQQFPSLFLVPELFCRISITKGSERDNKLPINSQNLMQFT